MPIVPGMDAPAVYNLAEAKARLSELVERAVRGEEIVIARRGRPAVRLTPAAPARRPRPGAWRGLGLDVAGLLAPVDPQTAAAWAGDTTDNRGLRK